MASTRNKNTKCDYKLQQMMNQKVTNHNLYKNSHEAYDPAFPDFYYRPSFLPSNFYTENATDIESSLKGINSSNLVNDPDKVVPQFKDIRFKPYFDNNNKVLLPEPLIIEKNQRPLFD